VEVIVHAHAEKALIALTQRMPVPASVIIDRLKKMEAPTKSVALEVCRMTIAQGKRSTGGSNGDSVLVIIREGKVITTMLRRSWDQSFSPSVLRVDEFQSWKEQWS
jgi:hypothetical protein